MAVRRRALEPDTTIWTQAYGDVAVVSDGAFLEMSVAFAQMQMIGGGVVTAIVERHPTDLPQEMVTTRAVFEWKDHTRAKPQPEAQTGVAVPAQPGEPVPADPTPEQLEEQLARQEQEDAAELEEPEEAEDDSAIPAGQR